MFWSLQIAGKQWAVAQQRHHPFKYIDYGVNTLHSLVLKDGYTAKTGSFATGLCMRSY
jgi:hypothetical protein